MTRRIGLIIDWLIDHLPEYEPTPHSVMITIFTAVTGLLSAILILNAHPWR